jgi:signal transduction histidine kinase
MNNQENSSVNAIRSRLLRIVLRAFAIVVGITLISILGITILEINKSAKQNPFYRSPSSMLLEAFYVGNGGWNNVDKLVAEATAPNSQFPIQDWNSSIILDENGIVIIDHGKTANTPLIGKVYMVKPGEPVTDIRANGVVVGKMINDRVDIPHPMKLTISFINPVVIVSLILAVFAVILGILLTQRVVNPIAEVIAAAERVAAGDLTTRIKSKNGKDDLSILVENFNEMTAVLEKNDNERRQLLADVAHELRTPLSVLRGRLEGIVDGIYPANDSSIAPVLEETYVLERLVEDLRLLTMAENRQIHFESKKVDVVQSMQRSISVFSAQAEEKGISLSLDSDQPSAYAWVDPQRLEQISGNVLDNAMRYVNSESGKVLIYVRHIDKAIKISIEDNGAGIPDGECARIFDRFWRSEKSRARVAGGAGLGMAIVKQLVEGQGGNVGAENVPAGGLRIWFTFPEPAEDNE